MVSWERMADYFPKIAAKFPVTLEIVVVSFGIGLILGICIALIRIQRIPVLDQLATVFISYVRCTPVICQLFVIYFGIPIFLKQIGRGSANVDNIAYVLIAYSLNMGGFLGEAIRSAVIAVPLGQAEAGQSVGLRGYQTMWYIVMPQALRIALPTLGTIFIQLFSSTALAYLVGVVDMVGKGRSLGAISGHYLEGYLCCAVIFAVISLVLEQILNLINHNLDFSGRRAIGSTRGRR